MKHSKHSYFLLTALISLFLFAPVLYPQDEKTTADSVDEMIDRMREKLLESTPPPAPVEQEDETGEADYSGESEDKNIKTDEQGDTEHDDEAVYGAEGRKRTEEVEAEPPVRTGGGGSGFGNPEEAVESVTEGDSGDKKPVGKKAAPDEVEDAVKEPEKADSENTGPEPSPGTEKHTDVKTTEEPPVEKAPPTDAPAKKVNAPNTVEKKDPKPVKKAPPKKTVKEPSPVPMPPLNTLPRNYVTDGSGSPGLYFWNYTVSTTVPECMRRSRAAFESEGMIIASQDSWWQGAYEPRYQSYNACLGIGDGNTIVHLATTGWSPDAVEQLNRLTRAYYAPAGTLVKRPTYTVGQSRQVPNIYFWTEQRKMTTRECVARASNALYADGLKLTGRGADWVTAQNTRYNTYVTCDDIGTDMVYINVTTASSNEYDPAGHRDRITAQFE